MNGRQWSVTTYAYHRIGMTRLCEQGTIVASQEKLTPNSYVIDVDNTVSFDPKIFSPGRLRLEKRMKYTELRLDKNSFYPQQLIKIYGLKKAMKMLYEAKYWGFGWVQGEHWKQKNERIKKYKNGSRASRPVTRIENSPA